MITYVSFSREGTFYGECNTWEIVYAGESAEQAQESIKDNWDNKVQTWQYGKLIKETRNRYTGGQWSQVVEKFRDN